jgi:hypothetical protein
MKTQIKAIILSFAALLYLASCNKIADTVIDKALSSGNTSGQTIQYIIKQGAQYCDQNTFKTVSVSEVKFTAKFDSTAIYKTLDPKNQYDINKLYGFSDNRSDHHQYSARFGWRWSDGALRLFAYVYNEGAVSSKELTTIGIGAEVTCSIKVQNNQYIFTVNGASQTMPRLSTTENGEGYQLYPYFGGDETAPHEIHVWITPRP